VPAAQLASADYLILLAYLGVALGVAWVMGRQGTHDAAASGEGPGSSWWGVSGYLSAHLGVLPVVGLAAAGARYGVAAAHVYWLGALAMVVVGLFVVPALLASQARTVPEYLGIRFDQRSRRFHAAMFVMLAVVSSGVSLLVVARMTTLLVGWRAELVIAAMAVLGFTLVRIGGWRGTRYHGVLHLLLLVGGLAPLVFLGLRATGGWELLQHRLTQSAINAQVTPSAYTHLWKGMSHPLTNSLGVGALGWVAGFSGILSLGYWGCDFRLAQHALAAPTVEGARRTPILAACFALVLPVLLVLPGMIAVILGGGEGATAFAGMGQGLIPAQRGADGIAIVDFAGRTVLDYDQALPQLFATLLPPGWLGLGVSMLLASCLAGLSASLTAAGIVWRVDVRGERALEKGSHERVPAPDTRAVAAALAVAVGIAAAVPASSGVVPMLQLVFVLALAPLLAVIGMGAWWRGGSSTGAFAGLVAGSVAGVLHHGVSLAVGASPGMRGAFLARLLPYRTELAQFAWTAIVAFATSLAVMLVASLFATSPGRPDPEEGASRAGDMARQPPPGAQRSTVLLSLVVCAAVMCLHVLFR